MDPTKDKTQLDENLSPDSLDISPSTSASSVIASSATKRLLLDSNAAELPDPKRSRAELDQLGSKVKSIALLLHWHEYLMRVFKVTDYTLIDTIADITSLISRVHKKFQDEEENCTTGSMSNRITNDFSLTVAGVTTTWAIIGPEMKAIAAFYSFNYWPTESGKADTGTLGSVIALFACYRSRFSEVRTGTNHMKLKIGNDTVSKEICTFGLSPKHSVLTTGCTFNPTIQSAEKQYLGPMTIAINLAMQQNRCFQEAWKKAFVGTFKWYSFAEEMADLLAGTKTRESTILGLLADIAMWGTTNMSNKAAFPFCMMLQVSRRIPEYKIFFSTTRDIPNTFLPASAIHERIKGMDFYWEDPFRFWDLAAKEKYKIRMGDNATERTKMEVVFHAVWGTQKEDLSLLRWMTGHSFQTRREIGSQYPGRGVVGENGEFQMITFKRFAKLCSPIHTNLMTGGQICRFPAFSGFCTQSVEIDSAFFKTLGRVQNQFIGLSRFDLKPKIISILYRLRDSVEGKIRKRQSIAFDTTKFFNYSADHGYGAPVDEIPLLEARYFYDQEDATD